MPKKNMKIIFLLILCALGLDRRLLASLTGQNGISNFNPIALESRLTSARDGNIQRAQRRGF